MANSTAAFERVVSLALERFKSPRAQQLHAEIARAEKAKFLAGLREKPTEIKTFVDGREGASEDTVKFGGVIRYEFRYVDVRAVVKRIHQELVRRSPVGPGKNGHYKDNHKVYLDGTYMGGLENIDSIENKPGHEWVITNSVPYSRVLEGGKRTISGHFGSGGEMERRSGLSVSAPNGIYEITAKLMRRIYRGAGLDIKFEYRRVVGGQALLGHLTSAQMAASKGRRIKSGRGIGGKDRWPAIVISRID